jgi:hypothetical protein
MSHGSGSPDVSEPERVAHTELEDASIAVHDAAAVIDDAAHVIESAAAAMEEAALIIQAGTTATGDAVRPERRLKPRFPRLRHEARVHWKHIAIYASVVLIVIFLGTLAIWSFIEKQSLIAIPDPLPKVTLITSDPSSRLTAAWVRFLTNAEMQPTLVPVEKVDALAGVVVLCEVQEVPPKLADQLATFIRGGGAIVVIGQPPPAALGSLSMSADKGSSDQAFQFSERVSPLLARLTPGHELAIRPSHVAFLKESPRMVVDARWKTNARAVIMHMEQSGTRYLWFGFDPGMLAQEDRQLTILIHTAFRWVDGQPISDGAVGDAQLTRTMSSETRAAAQTARFLFGVEEVRNPRLLRVRMTNRGAGSLENPTVEVWLPPRVSSAELGGDYLMKRNVTVTRVPDEPAYLVSVPSLASREDRVIKLKLARP